MKTLTDINKWYVDQTQAQLILLAREEIGNNRFVKNIKAIDEQYYIHVELKLRLKSNL